MLPVGGVNPLRVGFTIRHAGCALLVFFATQLAWPLAAFAMRQNQPETKRQRAGLEQALLGDEPGPAQVVAATPQATHPQLSAPAVSAGPGLLSPRQAGLEADEGGEEDKGRKGKPGGGLSRRGFMKVSGAMGMGALNPKEAAKQLGIPFV